MDIKTLSKEKKIEILEAIREKKRRDKLRKPRYVPNEGQLPAHLCTKPNRFVFSSNGSGKTTMAAQEAMWLVNGYNPVKKINTPVPCNVVVVLDHPSKVGDVWLPEMQKWFEIKHEWLQKEGRPYVNRIVFPNGSEIKFLSHEQPPLVFESIEVSGGVIWDEPPPRHIFVALKRAGRVKGRITQYLLIGTPLACAWLRSQVYEPWVKGELPDHECFRVSIEVNRKNLAEGYIESFASVLSEKEKKIRLEGHFFDLDGLALAHLFKRDKHLINQAYFQRYFDPQLNPCILAIDPHPSKKHVAVLIGADRDNNVYYIKETSEKLVARRFAKHLKDFIQGYRVVDIVCDSLGSAEMTGGEGFRSFIDILNEEGLRARATTWEEKSDEAFIERIRSVLALPDTPNNFGLYVPKLRILDGNSGIIKDIENVGWLKFKDIDVHKDKLDTRMTDHLSCLKYALAANPTYKKGREKTHIPAKPLYGMGKPKSKWVQIAYKRR